MGDGAHLVGFERPHDLEGPGEDPDKAIGAAEEDIVGAAGDRGYAALLRAVNKMLAEEAGRCTWRMAERSSSASFTSETSKYLNAFHWAVG